jgi:hypothetical protein
MSLHSAVEVDFIGCRQIITSIPVEKIKCRNCLRRKVAAPSQPSIAAVEERREIHADDDESDKEYSVSTLEEQSRSRILWTRSYRRLSNQVRCDRVKSKFHRQVVTAWVGDLAYYSDIQQPNSSSTSELI